MLTSDDFEDGDDRLDFTRLHDTLNWSPDTTDQGALRAAIGQLSDQQAVAAASSIFSLYARLTLKR
jgi:hypothetical protein